MGLPTIETLAPGVTFLSLPDSRFKTARLTAALFLPLREETAAVNAIVPHLLRRSCAAYPAMRALNRRLDTLYGARMQAGVTRLGDQQGMLLTANGIDDRFALHGEAIAASCADLLLSMLFEPAFEQGVFREEDVTQERRCLIENIEAEINEKRLYARHRCEQLLCPGEPYAARVYGTLENARAITPAAAAQAWEAMLATARIHWIYQGSDNERVAQAIGDAFAARGTRRPVELTTNTAFTPGPLREQTEEMAVKQAKLVMGFRLDMAEPSDDTMAARLMNALFGGTPHSLLFRNVREKYSLCYYCASSYDYQKGVLLVDSGVEESKADEARAEILHQLEELREGRFTDEDLESARRSVLNQFHEVDDLQASRESWYLRQTLRSVPATPDEEAAKAAAVTREQVCAAARRVTPVCVYLLKSGKEG